MHYSLWTLFTNTAIRFSYKIFVIYHTSYLVNQNVKYDNIFPKTLSNQVQIKIIYIKNYTYLNLLGSLV